MGINLGRLGVALSKAKTGYNTGRVQREQMDFDQDRELARETLGENFRRDQLSARSEQAAAAEQIRRDQMEQARIQAEAQRAATMERAGMELEARREQAQQNAELKREMATMEDRRSRDIAAQNNATRADMARLAASMRQAGPPPKPVPAPVAKAFLSNQQQLKTLERAITGVEANPEALGLKSMIPDALLNRLPGKSFAGGVESRAGVADVGSLVIHDRSGAAVTVSEFPRLRPFIPLPTDDHKTALTKLRRMYGIIQEETEGMREFYGPDQGFRGLPGGGGSPAQATPPRPGYRPNNPFKP